ncbi:MAG TPA: TRAP transporter substrate-binding protein [Burkholderiaceae bacterium]|nr:TRAP transporter substrate-binding protein [Burkholderiaceae bacterium]
MKRTIVSTLAATGLLAGTAAVAYTPATDLPQTNITVVGGLSNLTAYQNHEQPFWTQKVPELTDGKLTVDIKGFNEMGLKGPEILRLLGQGVLPFATATLSYFASDDPINEAIDLAGLTPSIETAREITDAFLPVYQEYYADDNIKVLGFSTYPAQVMFCNAEVNGLADLKGKKVRTSSRTQAEFVEAIGGSSVTIPFGEVVPALQNTVVDCAITGSMSGYSAKWYEVSTHLYALPINWNQQVHAVNQAYWDKLDPKVQEFLEANLPIMYNEIWEAAANETQEGYDCNTGSDNCTRDVKGSMKLVEPTDADRKELERITAEIVVPKWAERCSEQCVAAFNDTIGKILDINVAK